MPTVNAYQAGQFSWVDLMAHDAATAGQFYAALFGWEVVQQKTEGDDCEGPVYFIFELNGQKVAGMGEMFEEMKSQGIPPIWNSYVAVDDVNATAARVTELGGAVTMPPMQVFEAGWMAGFQDPTGAHFFVWQKNQHFGAEYHNEPNAWCWNELLTRDIETAKTFYANLFGWEYTASVVSPESSVPYDLIDHQGQQGGMMSITEEMGPMPPCWGIYFSVSDLSATVAKHAELGGTVLMPSFDTPVGPMAVLADPQGGTFSVIQVDEGH